MRKRSDNRLKQLIVLIGIFILSEIVQAKQEPLPTPLDLKTALSFATGHPRTKLTVEQKIQSPIVMPLFLGCHNLTFNNTSIIDSKRNSITTNLVKPAVQQKLLILQSFFDVLLSDSSLIGVNEDMAGTFILTRQYNTDHFRRHKQFFGV